MKENRILFRILITGLLFLAGIPLSEGKRVFYEKTYAHELIPNLKRIQNVPPVEKVKPKHRKRKRIFGKRKNKRSKRAPNFNRNEDIGFGLYLSSSLIGLILLILGGLFLSFGLGAFSLGLIFLTVGDALAIVISSIGLFPCFSWERKIVLTTIFGLTLLANLGFSLVLLLGAVVLTGGVALGGVMLGLAVLLLAILIFFIVFSIAMEEFS
jgi:hypothetical protein